MGVSSCTGPKEWKGVADCNAGGGEGSLRVQYVLRSVDQHLLTSTHTGKNTNTSSVQPLFILQRLVK